MTEGNSADWTVERFREPSQGVADRIDELIDAGEPGGHLGLADGRMSPEVQLLHGVASLMLRQWATTDIEESAITPA